MSQLAKQKRRSRREALASFFSTDLSDIEWYQPGRTKIPVFATEDWYYCATREGERPPEGWRWHAHGTSYHYQIHRASAIAGVYEAHDQ
jgi:hypothetical protein